MRVVLDTNVLISATFWSGDSDKIICKAERKELELVISKEIIDEFSAVLGYDDIQEKILGKNLEMRRTVEKIRSISTMIEPKEKYEVIKDDPDDDKFLDCAVAGKADVIISKDKHLLRLKDFNGITIMTPAEFLEAAPKR